MQLFVFPHEPPVTAGCCNWATSATYWFADSRDAARQEIEEHTPGGDRPHGLCASCMVRVLTSEAYEIVEVDG
jgi:hypothetical protein